VSEDTFTDARIGKPDTTCRFCQKPVYPLDDPGRDEHGPRHDGCLELWVWASLKKAGEIDTEEGRG
jgi:hypothetical protein